MSRYNRYLPGSISLIEIIIIVAIGLSLVGHAARYFGLEIVW